METNNQENIEKENNKQKIERELDPIITKNETGNDNNEEETENKEIENDNKSIQIKSANNKTDFVEIYNNTSDKDRFTKIKDKYYEILTKNGGYKKICENFESFEKECNDKGLNVSKNSNGEIIATFKNIDTKDNMKLQKDGNLYCTFYEETQETINEQNNEDSKKNNDKESTEESEEEEEEEEEEKTSNAGIVVAVILILLAITIIGLLTYFLLKKQNKKEETNNTNQQQNTEQDTTEKNPPSITGTPTTEAKDETGQPVISGNTSSTLNTSVNVSVPENSTMTQTEISILKEAANIEMNPNAITVVNGEQYSGFKVDNGTAYGWDAMGTKHTLGNYNNIEAYYGADRKPISNAVMTAMSKYHQVANGNGGLDYVKW